MQSSTKPVVVVGGGPGGSAAALCLRKLGREVIVLERFTGPRYRIGESLLPGTLSILYRLGLSDRIEAAGFTKKRSATFLWGTGQSPFSFTFATPKTAPWVFGYSYQVTRAEYDYILLTAAKERGADVREGAEVTDVGIGLNGEEPWVKYKGPDGKEVKLEASFVIDASGSTGVVARRLNNRRFDEYYKNLAVWSYWKGGKRYHGSLEGNIFSVSFQDGWMWIIPLKDDIYSIGVVTGVENTARIKEVGPDAFYHESLAKSAFATDIIQGARQSDEVRVFRDWAYESEDLAVGKSFLCGDSGCFIDPLFSQGVHLATYSAMMASAGIDYLYQHPDELKQVQAWYDRSYRDAYNGYHKFLSAFYAKCDEPNSKFWESRRIHGAVDERLQSKEWYASLTGQHQEISGVQELEQSAATLRQLWDHGGVLSEDQNEETLHLRRISWANEVLRSLRKMEAISWLPEQVSMADAYRVHPETFKLVKQSYVADEEGRPITSIPVTPGHRALFEGMRKTPISYKDLSDRIMKLGGPLSPQSVVGRLLERGMLKGVDAKGMDVHVNFGLRFRGVGAEDQVET